MKKTNRCKEEKEIKDNTFKDLEDCRKLNNKLEFNLHTLRLEFEKPIREYNQLKKEFDLLTNSCNDLLEK